MRKISDLIFLCLITLAAACLIVLVGFFLGHRNLAFAFLANWTVMTWGALVAGSVGYRLPLPPGYFRIRPFEASGRFYRRLGVRSFRWLLVRSPLSSLNATVRYSGARSSLNSLEQKMRDSESSHLLILAVMIGITLGAAVMGWWDLVVWLTVFNFLMNGYPIVLQRYNRARIAAIKSRDRICRGHSEGTQRD